MTWSLVLAESEVAALDLVEGRLSLRFAAASVWRREPGDAAPTAGWGRGLTLVLEGARVIEQAPPGLGRLAEGRLRVDGAWRRELPLPCRLQGALSLELEFAHRGHWLVEAEALSLRWAGDASFHETLAC